MILIETRCYSDLQVILEEKIRLVLRLVFSKIFFKNEV